MTSNEQPTDAAGGDAASPEKRRKSCAFSSNGCNKLTFPPREKKLTVIKPPRQRQGWDDTQEQPHVNWGDLFFDLFYVGLAYNLATLIKASPTKEGILYFSGCFFPVMMCWIERMWFDSRFWVDDDPFHRVFEVVQLCLLATAVLHIGTVEEMSNPEGSREMFAFTLSVTLLIFGNVLRYIEVALWVEGGPEAKPSGWKGAKTQFLILPWFVAATAVSGSRYFGNSDGYSGSGGGHRLLAAAGGEPSYPENGSESDSGGDGRNIPIYLCIGGWLAFNALMFATVFYFAVKDVDVRKLAVPMNIDFAIHRYGEWTMLILGESILSLVISDLSENAMFYVTFYSGVLSAIVLQYLHYRSQPHDANHHALRRSIFSGVSFTFLMQIYSGALVLVGASFKMLLYEYSLDEYDEGHRRLETSFSPFITEDSSRSLAGGSSSVPVASDDEREQRISNFYCGNLAVALFCLDLMIIAHKGINTNMERCQCQRSGKISKAGAFLVVFRVALVVFIATLSQYVWEPEYVALIGLAVLLAEVGTRVAGDFVYPDVRVHAGVEGGGSGKATFHQEESEHWPNITHAMPDPAHGGTPEVGREQKKAAQYTLP